LSDDTREIITFTKYGESPEISDWDDLIDNIEALCLLRMSKNEKKLSKGV
jgi:hypothetical protein